ncbi:MAG: TrkA family potassium uptake protein [Firmicutes bacterium]|jgi:trk system potassium uptake protein TrkA|nr:TrkA family potassium uptake protein [Bacillota bacterium]
MDILLAGGGIVGQKIAKALSKKHNVVVIESNMELCEKIASKYGVVVINGDATSIQTLREAGIENCQYALGVMNDDTQNLLFSLLCKNFDVKNIFVRMKDPEYREAYEIAGATNIGNSVEMMANKFVLDIENPEIRRVASISKGKAEIAIINLDENTKHNGRTIEELSKDKTFPKDMIIAAIFDTEKDELVIPKGKTKISSGNQLFLVGSRKAIELGYKFFVR